MGELVTGLYIPKDYYLGGPGIKYNLNTYFKTIKKEYSFISTTIWDLDISESWNILLYMYHFARPIIKDKKEADRIFMNNMLRLITAKTDNVFLKWLRRKAAFKLYINMVRYGGPIFWAGKNDSDNIKFYNMCRKLKY